MRKDAILQGQAVTLPEEYDNLVDMLLFISSKYPEKGMRFIDASGRETFYTYSELLDKASQCLKQLQKRGFKAGDIAIIEVASPPLFYPLFWACILGGMIPAPITKPASFEPGSDSLVKLFNVWKVLKKPTIFIEEGYQSYYQKLKDSPLCPTFDFIPLSDLQGDENADFITPLPHDLAILQFSSGSTGTPKGVQLTHQNILANIKALGARFGLTDADNTFMWVPHTHDMGLFMQYLSSVMAGCQLMIFSPHTFVRSPYLFLKKITEHKGTWFTCPNFGFDWMERQVPDEKRQELDLSSLRFILNASEPISASVVRRFFKKFEPCHFTPNQMCTCYGLAEATVGVTVSTIGETPKIENIHRQKMIAQKQAIRLNKEEDNVNESVEFLQEGSPIEGVSVRIANDKGQLLKENEIGEIQVKGLCVTKGYYNCDEVNEKLFDQGWLRTGDLGFIVDGALVITGRMKDVLFVRGQNYYSHDLEEIIFKTEQIKRGHLAFVGLFNPRLQQEELIAFLKHKGSIEAFLPLRQFIMSQMQEVLGIEVAEVIPIKSLPKTTSGKLRRFYLRECYEKGEYEALLREIKKEAEAKLPIMRSSKVSEDELVNYLLEVWAKLLNIPKEKIACDASFFSLGGNSIKAFQLLHEIEHYLKQEVELEILVACKTINDLVNYIQSNKLKQEKIAPQKTSINETREPIAITGMSLRLPHAKNKEIFWDNLCAKKNCFSKVSERRKAMAGRSHWEGWLAELEDIDSFDHAFFEIPAEEAQLMDPQQRLILEVAYEALDDAGLIPHIESHSSNNIGVYSGISGNSYYELLLKYLEKNGSEKLHPHALISNMPNMISALLARTFNLTGPAVVVDTACSSFLSALHQAIKALRQNEIEGAIVASANILSTPHMHILSHKAGILSKGACPRVFDESADGSVLGEGVLVFYLEPLSAALKNNRNIYGLIRGSATNNDGRSFGRMAPSPVGQYNVLLKAYKDAEISPHEISYIETHGTGTTIGDPIEVNTLARLFKKQEAQPSIGIGSVKTNVGHLLPAAGAAGLAKILLCFKYKKRVPNLNVNKLNPALKLEKSPFYVVDAVEDWKVAPNQTRKAGLSSFGFGGTNVHMVLEEWNRDLEPSDNAFSHHLLTISAKTETALKKRIELMQNLLADTNNVDVNNLCFTQNCCRQHYSHRQAFLINQEKKVETIFTPLTIGVSKKKPLISVWIDDIFQTEQKSLGHWHLIFKALQQTAKANFKIVGQGSGSKLAWLLNKEGNSSAFDTKESDFIIHLSDLSAPQNPTNKEIIEIRKSLEKANSHHHSLFYIVGQLYIRGVDFYWDNLYSGGSGRMVSLPSYPFEKKSFWISL